LPDHPPEQEEPGPFAELPSEPPPTVPMYSSGFVGAPPPIFRPSTSTPLEEDEPEDLIPPAALWAMKYRRHLHLTLTPREDERLRDCLGGGDGAVYVIDDGGNHCMIGRLVGADEDGSTYSLVGRITAEAYERYAEARSPLEDIYSEAKDLSLCGVYAAPGAVSNVLAVEKYRGPGDVPPEYLPGRPFLEFADDETDDG
jgi:hypothetical protein